MARTYRTAKARWFTSVPAAGGARPVLSRPASFLGELGYLANCAAREIAASTVEHKTANRK